MKKYITLAAVVAMMASCADNTVKTEIEEEVVEIGFASGFVDKATKAELTMNWFTTDDNNFGVYGYKGSDNLIFGQITATPTYTAEEVKWTSNDWKHSTVRFWDKAATYEFYAYAPYGENPTFADKKFGFSNINVINPIQEGDGKQLTGEDLAIATPLTSVTYDKCLHPLATGHGAGHVEFTFNHILSKLSFKVKTTLKIDPVATTTTPGDNVVKSLKVKNIALEFPSGKASWDQTAADAVAGTTSYVTTGDGAGKYVAKVNADGSFVSTPTYATVVYNDATGEALENGKTVAIGNSFIVTPVNEVVKDHKFGIKVVYAIEYKDGTTDELTSYGVIGKYNETAINYTQDEADAINKLYLINDVTGKKPTDVGYEETYMDGFTEITTSTVKVPVIDERFKPEQNGHYAVVINIDPTAIEFCVEDVNAWDEKDAVDVTIE